MDTTSIVETKIDFKDFNSAKACAKLLRSDNEREVELGRNITIMALENYNNLTEELLPIWNDLIEASGFYPYLNKENIRIESSQSEIRINYHQSKYREDVFYHDDQKKILNLLLNKKNVVVSAPTSFGKSLLIEEIVASLMYSNIVIIQPTLALLDETRKKLNKYADRYKIIVRTSQEPSMENNIFLFTAERVIEYSTFPTIDFLVIDEFYKLSSKRDDERSDSLNNAFSKLHYSYRPQFYLLGPNVDKISDRFIKMHNAVFFKTNFSLVLNESIDLYTANAHNFGTRGLKREYKENTLYSLLHELNHEQTIVFCSSPSKAKKLAKGFCNYISKIGNAPESEELPLNEWIRINIHPQWSMIDIINKGIGIHDGSLPKHITSSMIEYFNMGKLRYLFCTTTIIEGVNTTSKNIIYYDNTKGLRQPIDYFDYCNIKGRAGRMMIHYTGRIFNFNPVPQRENIEIDIPFVDQNPVSDEVLINLPREDVSDHLKSKYDMFETIENGLKLIIKRNGVSIDGQLKIYNDLNSNFENIYGLINWTGYPTYKQLGYVLDLAWNNLLKKGETTSPMTCSKLTKMTFDYGTNKSIQLLVRSTYDYKRDQFKDKTDIEVLDMSIAEIYQIVKHWFSYKVPKWLSVIDSIQIYICNRRNLKAGEYTFYSNEIENDFIPHNLSLLTEYGIPNSAIRKLSDKIPVDTKDDDVIRYILRNELHKMDTLIKYEREKLIETLM